MKIKQKSVTVSLSIYLLFIIACGGGSSPTPEPIVTPNIAPTANAGDDQSVNEATLVQLDGSASSDSDGSVASYTWLQMSGLSVTLSNPDTGSPSFTSPEIDQNESLVFQLTVTDNDGATASDTVTIELLDVTAQNNSPTANAGSDQTVNEATLVQLDGSASSDLDGSIASYAWLQMSGLSVALSSNDTDSPSFTAPEIDQNESLVFQLTVTDNDGANAIDTVTIELLDVSSPPETFSVGGNVTGLVGEVEISLNNVSNLSLTSNQSFTFLLELELDDNYQVSVITQPIDQTCNLVNDTGLITSDVNNIEVNCSDNPQNNSPINDEFSAAIDFETTASSTWSVHQFDGTSRADTIEANLEKSDWLVIEPVIPSTGVNMGWFQDVYSSFLYQEVAGNFSVVTKLRVVSRSDENSQPVSTNFNAGGFVIRDPSGTHNGNENWVMYNMGAQTSDTAGNTYSREIKKTVNSVSNMFLTDQDGIEEILLACRVGDDFYFYFWDEVINNWREETFYNNADLNGNALSTRIANGTSITPEIAATLPSTGNTSPISFRFDAANNFFMPETLQVGVIAHNWTDAGDVRAEFDFVRFAVTIPNSKSNCLIDFEGLGLP